MARKNKKGLEKRRARRKCVTWLFTKNHIKSKQMSSNKEMSEIVNNLNIGLIVTKGTVIKRLSEYIDTGTTVSLKAVPLKSFTGNNFYISREWRKVRIDALIKNGRSCCVCGRSAKDGIVLHVDHIKPRSKFPELELELSNLQILCEDCNLGKSNRYEDDWRISEAFKFMQGTMYDGMKQSYFKDGELYSRKTFISIAKRQAEIFRNDIECSASMDGNIDYDDLYNNVYRMVDKRLIYLNNNHKESNYMSIF